MTILLNLGKPIAMLEEFVSPSRIALRQEFMFRRHLANPSARIFTLPYVMNEFFLSILNFSNGNSNRFRATKRANNFYFIFRIQGLPPLPYLALFA